MSYNFQSKKQILTLRGVYNNKISFDCWFQVRVQAGSRAVLDCGAGGDEPLEFQWTKNRTKLERQEGSRLVVRMMKIKMVIYIL